MAASHYKTPTDIDFFYDTGDLQNNNRSPLGKRLLIYERYFYP